MTERMPGVKFLLFVLVCTVAAAWVFSVTGNFRWVPFLTPTDTYRAELRDATGMRPGDDVRLSGVPVGRVEGLEVEQGTAVVEFSLKEEVTPTDTWEAGPRWRNVTGQRYLYLYEGEGGEPLGPGGRIPVERSRTAANIDRFFAEITPLLKAIDAEAQNKLLHALNETLVGREEQVQDLVTDLGSLSRTVADTEPELRTVLREGNELLGEYNRRSSELDSFIGDLSSVSSTLRTRNDELLGAISDIADVQERFGDLLTENDAHIRGLIDDTEVITGTIDANLDDFTRSVETLSEGFATYMLISRWGEWFNVRAVALQTVMDGEVLYCQVEDGSACHEPNLGTKADQSADHGTRGIAGRALGERRDATIRDGVHRLMAGQEARP